jgi:hypothetical protein
MGHDKVSFDSIRFVCRIARKLHKDPAHILHPDSKRHRREGGTCTCRVQAKRYRGINGLPDHYRFEHSSQKESNWEHSHSIDDSDSIKINGFLKAALVIEAAKGFMPAECYAKLRSVKMADENGVVIGDALDVCGGIFMTRMHANNANLEAIYSQGRVVWEEGHHNWTQKTTSRFDGSGFADG